MTISQRISLWSVQHPVFAAFLFGACLGFIAPSVYIIAGGDTFLFVPTWARILFFPGFFAGSQVYPLGGFEGAYIVGILAVSISYGLVALCIRLLLRSRSRQS